MSTVVFSRICSQKGYESSRFKARSVTNDELMELVAGAKNGCQDNWEKLVSLYEGLIDHHCRKNSFSVDEYEERKSMLFLEFVRAIHRLDPNSKAINKYLLTCLRRAAPGLVDFKGPIRVNRKFYKRFPDEAEAARSGVTNTEFTLHSSPHDPIDEVDELDRFEVAIRKIEDKRSRRIARLVINGARVSEIAKYLDLSLARVYAYRKVAISLLKSALNEV